MRLTWVVGCVLLVVGLVVRFAWLGEVPGGLNHDQTDVILIARSFLARGEDPQGNKLPLALVKRQTEMGDDSVLSLFFVPSEALGLGLAGARLPLVLANVITMILVGLMARSLEMSRRVAVIASLVFWCSPWSIAFTRGDAQAPLAVMLFMTALVTSVRHKPGFVGFAILTWWVYYGFRPLMLILVPLLIVWKSKSKLIPLSGWVLFILGYFLIVTAIPDSTLNRRLNESPLNNLDRYASEVNDLRKSSLINPFIPLFVNKYTLLGRDLAKNYMGTFGPDFLVWHGDERAVYRFGDHGVLYVIDVVLIVVGTTTGFPALLWVVLVLAPIGSVLSTSDVSHIYRASLVLPALSILTAVGINKWWRFRLVLGAVYILSFANFLQFYLFEYPIAAGEMTGVSERVVANYANRAESLTIVAQFPGQLKQQYLLYGGSRQTEPIITSSCDPDVGQTLIVQAGGPCHYIGSHITIQDQKDARTTWFVYNDQLCTFETLDPWRRVHRIDDYAMEIMTDATFCNRWLHRSL